MENEICLHLETSVVRTLRDGLETRRQRRCKICKAMFWTIEKVEPPAFTVIKTKKGNENFSFDKLYHSIEKAFQGLEVEKEEIDKIAYRVLQRLIQETPKNVVTSSKIGRLVLEELDSYSPTAWVRFAGYYLSGKDDEALAELRDQLKPLIRVGRIAVDTS